MSLKKNQTETDALICTQYKKYLFLKKFENYHMFTIYERKVLILRNFFLKLSRFIKRNKVCQIQNELCLTIVTTKQFELIQIVLTKKYFATKEFFINLLVPEKKNMQIRILMHLKKWLS